MQQTSAIDLAFAEVLSLEKALASATCRRDKDRLVRLLCDDFCEFGRSGKRYDKAAIIQQLLEEQGEETHYEFADVKCEMLSDSCILLTYRSISNQQDQTWRTSIWRLEQGQWRVLHHQGTTTAPTV